MNDRLRRHVFSQLLCLGRHTLTGVLGTAGRIHVDWSADYKIYAAKRVQAEDLFAPIRTSLLNRLHPSQPAVVALDDTRLPKSGKKTHGVKYTRDPLGPPFHLNLIKAQRFLQLSMAATTDGGLARVVPIDFVHAPPVLKPKPHADDATWAAYRKEQREKGLPRFGAQRLHQLRAAMDQEGQAQRPLWAVVDGSYTNTNFLKNVPERTVAIGRIRSDAKLYHLPDSFKGKPGRNRVYGEEAPTPEALGKDTNTPWQKVRVYAAGKKRTMKVKTLSPVRWRKTGKVHDLRLVVIAPVGYRLTKHSRINYRKPAYLICTDPSIPLQELVQAYIWRWDIEVNFRDEKTLLGVGQAQVRNVHSVEQVPAVAVASYALLLTAAIQVYGVEGTPITLPSPKWRSKKRARASTQNLINHLRHELWGRSLQLSDFASSKGSQTKSDKYKPSLKSALFYVAA